MQGTALGTTSWLPCLPRQFCPQTVAPRIALMRKLARLNPGQAVPEAHGQVDVALPQELAGFRPNVGVCVVNSEGMVFAARRCDDTARTWQMPQGGIDAGESAVQAAVRVSRHTGDQLAICDYCSCRCVPHSANVIGGQHPSSCL